MTKVITIGEYSYLIEERWKKIYHKGYDLNFEVSNTGKVRNTVTGHIRTLDVGNNGYLRLTIRVRSLKKTLHFLIHRLVALLFIPIPEKYAKKGLSYDDLQVNHLNGNKEDNVVLNLEWSTQSDNTKHAFATGLKFSPYDYKYGRVEKKVKEKKIPKKRSEYGPHVNYDPYTIYSEDQIRKACKMMEDEIPNPQISSETGIPTYYLSWIRSGKTWKHISSQYNIKMLRVKRPKEIENKVIELLLENKSTNDIIDILQMEDNDKNKHYIQKVKRRMKKKQLDTSLNDYPTGSTSES